MKLIPMILGHQYGSHSEAPEHAAVLIDILVVLLRRFRPVLFHPSVVLKCGFPMLLRWNIQFLLPIQIKLYKSCILAVVKSNLHYNIGAMFMCVRGPAVKSDIGRPVNYDAISLLSDMNYSSFIKSQP